MKISRIIWGWLVLAIGILWILGGIFDTLSAALRLYPTIRPSSLERMADFTRVGAAIAVALGYGEEEFLSAYDTNNGKLRC